MPRRNDRKFARALRPYADAYVLAFGPQQFFNGSYAPDEYEFHVRVMDALKVDWRNEPHVRKYFHAMDIRMGKLRPGEPLSSHNRGKRVDVQVSKFRDWEHVKDAPDRLVHHSPARQMGKSRALSAMYGSNPMMNTQQWWPSFHSRSDIARADEDYRTSVLNK